MSTPVLPRCPVVLALFLGLCTPIRAVEPVDYEQAPHILYFTPTLVEIVKTTRVGNAMFGLASNGDVYLFDPSDRVPFPDPILVGTGATDIDAWGSAAVLILNVPGQGVRFVDVSSATTPADIQTVPVSSPAIGQGSVVELGQGGARYTTAGPSIVYSFVMCSPDSTPTEPRTGLVPSLVNDIVAHDEHAYAATQNGILHIYPDSPFSHQVVVYDEDTATVTVSITESGDTLGAAQGSAGAAVYTIDGNGVPTRSANITGDTFTISVNDELLLRGDGNFTFSYDISDPSNPQPAATVVTPGANSTSSDFGDTNDVGTDDGVVTTKLLGEALASLAEYTFSLPNHVESDRSQPGIVFTANNFVIESFDFSDPQLLASLDFHAITNIEDFVVKDGRAYATQTGGGLHVLDVSDPNDIILTAFLGAITGTVLEISDSGDCGIVGFDDMVRLFDASDPQNPMPRGSFTFDGAVVDVLLNDNIAVVYHTTAVTVLDISDKDNPTQLSRYEGLSAILALSATSADDFMVHAPGRVSRIDVDTGATISSVDVPVGDTGVLERAEDFAGKAPGETYYLSDDAGTILVLDWTDPAQPRIVGEISDPDFAPRALTVTANILVVAEDVGPGRLSFYPAHGKTATGTVAPVALTTTMLRSVYPNPSPGLTNILLEMPRSTPGSLQVYDLRGRRVRTLFSGRLTTGTNLLSWDGRNDHGRTVAAGRYFIRAAFGERAEARAVTVLR